MIKTLLNPQMSLEARVYPRKQPKTRPRLERSGLKRAFLFLFLDGDVL